MKSSTSDLLVASCDEFVYYDDLVRAAAPPPAARPRTKKAGEKKREAIERVLETTRSLERDYDPVWGSLVKQTVRRIYPSFNEEYYGYRNFSEVLEAAEDAGLVKLDYDEARGNYRVRPATR